MHQWTPHRTRRSNGQVCGQGVVGNCEKEQGYDHICEMLRGAGAMLILTRGSLWASTSKSTNLEQFWGEECSVSYVSSVANLQQLLPDDCFVMLGMLPRLTTTMTRRRVTQNRGLVERFGRPARQGSDGEGGKTRRRGGRKRRCSCCAAGLGARSQLSLAIARASGRCLRVQAGKAIASLSLIAPDKGCIT